LRLSRNQIEVLIIGALILAFLVYNFADFNEVLSGDNGSAVPATNTPVNTSNGNATSTANTSITSNMGNGSATDISTNTYSAHGVSFNYPNTWSMYSDNSSGDEVIVVYKDDSTQFQVQITPNNGMSEQEVIDSMENSIYFFGWWNKISNSTLTVDNKTAYKDTFTVYSLMPFIIDGRYEQIYFLKNGKTYSMLLQAQNNDFDKEKQNFDIILNSFKVH